MNQTYEIKAESPLLRPGLTITVRVSEGYAEKAVELLLELVRKVNECETGSGG